MTKAKKRTAKDSSGIFPVNITDNLWLYEEPRAFVLVHRLPDNAEQPYSRSRIINIPWRFIESAVAKRQARKRRPR